MSPLKCLSSFFLALIMFSTGCNHGAEKVIERPQPIKATPVKNVEIKVPQILKPIEADSVVEDTLKHYHQETNKNIETKYLKRSFNLHKKPSVA